MGKPTGFLEYQRQLPKDRPPKERMKDWDEFHTHFDLAQLQLKVQDVWTAVYRFVTQVSKSEERQSAVL